MYGNGGYNVSNNGYGPSLRQPLAMPTTMAGSSFQGMGGDYAAYMGR